MMKFDIPDQPWDKLELWHIADAVLCSPDSHPDVFRKRIASLRAQGEHAFADHVESAVDLSAAAVETHERTSRALTRFFDQVIESADSRPK